MEQMDKKDYQELVKRKSTPSPILKNTCAAFLVGGGICVFGELLGKLYEYLGVTGDLKGTLVTVTLIFIAVLLTGLDIYDNLAKFAGAGTLVPVTGFANSVVAAAIDTKAEGWVLGVGAKIFTIAGPVILYGTLSSVIYGIIYAVIYMIKM